ncbi:sulfite exporter TauE/SafE family protein [Polaromonas jejuensis]|uniref:Probable membrane transporter protein n=1 Tax=Polaromonas jejuensis TaxID=457502 RepID=A0ABW0QHH9_9BURK|nr:sulfite exporter TauE/SafE family protein [Polaromonas jejuensis]
MDSQTALIVTGAVVAGFVQGLSGFGFGLVAMSFWAWTLDPRLAAALVVCGALTGQLIAAVTVRRGFELRRLAPFLAGGLLGIPVGLLVLPWLDVQMFKTFLGLLLMLWCPAMLMAGRLPRIRVGGRLGDGLAGSLGGVMSAMGGFSGVIPTLWCTLRGYDKDAQRAIIQNFNLAVLAVTMSTYVATGIVTRDTLPMLAVVIPAMLIPSLLGGRVYIGLSEAAFRKIVLGLLTASGLALLASSLPLLLGRAS